MMLTSTNILVNQVAVQCKPTRDLKLSINKPKDPEDLLIVIKTIFILKDMTPILWTTFVMKTAMTVLIRERTLSPNYLNPAASSPS
jgi:hypothetical protein